MPTQIGRNMYTAVNERIIAVHSKDEDGNGVKVGCSVDTDIVWLKEPDIQDEIRDTLESIKNRLEDNAQLLLEAHHSIDKPISPDLDSELIVSSIEKCTKESDLLRLEMEKLEQVIMDSSREILMKSTVTINQDGKDHTFTGYAHEKEVPFDPSRRNQDVNTTSFIENCETSARGRALGAAGIGIEEAVASADEVRNAQAQGQRNQTASPHDARQAPQNQKPLDLLNKENLHNSVFALFRKNQESLESQGIDYWGSVKVIFGVESRAEMAEDQWKRLLALTQDTQNWSKHFIVKLEPDAEEPDPKESNTEQQEPEQDAPVGASEEIPEETEEHPLF